MYKERERMVSLSRTQVPLWSGDSKGSIFKTPLFTKNLAELVEMLGILKGVATRRKTTVDTIQASVSNEDTGNSITIVADIMFSATGQDSNLVVGLSVASMMTMNVVNSIQPLDSNINCVAFR